MKKAFFLFVLCLTSIRIHALPLGNPADASLYCCTIPEEVFGCSYSTADLLPCDWIYFRLGYYGDFVYNRNFKVKELETHVERFQMNTNAGYLAFNFCNRVDIFGTLGTTHVDTSTSLSSIGQGPPLGRVTVIMGTDFSWSVGARGTLLRYCCTALGMEFQYFNSRLDISRILQTDSFTLQPIQLTKYREWQVGLGITHQIALLFPYIGVKWAHADVNLPEGAIINLKSAKHWGYAVGTTLVVCSSASLTAEGRWGDEKALYINGQFRF